MSLLEFPPLNTDGRPFSIQEFNGRLVTGNEDEFRAVNQSEVLADYPSIDKSQLASLQHSMSKDNVRGVFAMRECGSVEQAWNRWSREGISGVVDHVANVTEDTKLWPIAKFSRGVLRVHNGVSSMTSRILNSHAKERTDEMMQEYGRTRDWKNNWLRCIAFHEDGKRLAVCQKNDYIRVYGVRSGEEAVGGKQRPPLTLKHPQQVDVTCMAWEPYDQRVLAVAASNRILIWKISSKHLNNKPSASNVHIISLSVSPISHIIWDKTTSTGLLATSPNSNKIMLIDTLSGDVDSVGAWSGGSITGIVPTRDGRRLAVMYTSNMIRVYHRDSWSDERWRSLPGRAIDAVWSPNGDSLLFSTDCSPQIFSISFAPKSEMDADGQAVTRWSGESTAKHVFSLLPVEFDPSELAVRGHEDRPIVTIGGRIQSMELSPDGQRLAVSFRDNPSVVALFIVDWTPVVRLTPSGLVEAPPLGTCTSISFLPNFSEGSLLSITWSGGRLQYLPLIYGSNASIIVNTRNILDEISARATTIETGRSFRAVSVSDSLRSGDLPSNLLSSSQSEKSERVLFSERIRQQAAGDSGTPNSVL